MASRTSKCRGCLNKANFFCYVCGDFTTVAQRRTITSLLRTAYFHNFDCKISDQNKSWAPHICCKPCYNGLTAWFNGKKAAFNFAVPMVWREPRNHADVCYFCLTNITGLNASSRKKIKYPNLWSAMRPVPHSDDLPVPTPPVNKDLLSSSDEVSDGDTSCCWCTWKGSQRLGKGTGKGGNRRKNRYHSGYNIVEISLNTEESHWNLSKLGITQTPVKSLQPTLVWKTHKE